MAQVFCEVLHRCARLEKDSLRPHFPMFAGVVENMPDEKDDMVAWLNSGFDYPNWLGYRWFGTSGIGGLGPNVLDNVVPPAPFFTERKVH